jgi:hypothetical protein
MARTFTEREKAHYTRQHEKARFATPEAEYEWASTQNEACSKCGEMHPLSYYPGNTCGNDAFYSTGLRRRRLNCKTCMQKDTDSKNEAVTLAKSLGIPYKAPEGTVCEKCQRPPNEGNGLVFDHDHIKKTFRGYLCDACNRSIGVLGDDVQGLLDAVNYVLKKDPKTIEQRENGSLYIVQ